MKYLKSSALVAALIASAITVGACQRKGEVTKTSAPTKIEKVIAAKSAPSLESLEARVTSLEQSRTAARAQFAKLQARAKAAGFQ